jgi:hypothetical protein
MNRVVISDQPGIMVNFLKSYVGHFVREDLAFFLKCMFDAQLRHIKWPQFWIC